MSVTGLEAKLLLFKFTKFTKLQNLLILINLKITNNKKQIFCYLRYFI